MKYRLCAALGLATAFAAGAASAEVTIGVSLGATSPGASLGIHYKNAFSLLPKTLGGEPVRYIILDDASDPTNAAKNARKLVSEDKVDALMGSNGVPSAVQMTQVAAEAKTPMIALTPIPPLPPERAAWIFVVPQTTELMMGAIAGPMKQHRVKTVGYIGFSDTWGDLVLKALEFHAAAAGYKIVTNERYARADTSVTGQVLKIMAANPDAVVVGGSGTGGALMAKPRLLLDEPSLGLAPKIVRDVFHIIADLKRTGVSIPLVEQNARAALQVADFGYVLETGEFALEGSAADLAASSRVIGTYLGFSRRAQSGGQD